MFEHILFILLIGQLSFSSVIRPIDNEDGCSIDITELNPEPILVSSTDLQFLYPDPDEDSIFLKSGESVVVACPGGDLEIDSKIFGTVTATCSSDNKFDIDGNTYEIESISCSKHTSTTARYTGESCELDGKEIEVGFLLTDDTFARQYIICFDDVSQAPSYSVYNLTKSIGHRETGVSRPTFAEGDFYNIGSHTVNELYTRNTQRKTINFLLGLSESSTKYIASTGNYYLARGHLTAKADFVYDPQQYATFYYVNAAPQWQSFNGNNWRYAEDDVREYAETHDLDLIVYTGTYGITTLPHEETGEETQLYLYVAEDGTVGIPVPELFWKVVYDSKAKKGVVLLGINNPYQEDVTANIICTDISNKITWLTWKQSDITQGYCYVCDINDVKDIITQLPDLDVSGGLLE